MYGKNESDELPSVRLDSKISLGRKRRNRSPNVTCKEQSSRDAELSKGRLAENDKRRIDFSPISCPRTREGCLNDGIAFQSILLSTKRWAGWHQLGFLRVASDP